jgi:site-specific recombinase XerD
VTGTALRVLEGGGRLGAWAELFERDRWRQSELPHGDLSSKHRGDRTINFARIVQPWLKESAKRWARTRLLAGTSVGSVACYLGDLTAFSEWLAEQQPEAAGPRWLTRELLEDYLLFVRTEPLRAATRQRRIGTLRMLIEEQREDGLAGLDRSAVIHGAEIPRVDYRLPKQLPEDIFTQLVDPANLALLREEWHRTVVLLLAFTGMRVSSVITLSRDPLSHGPDAQPYLRYWNVKLHREAMLPIPELLEAQLRRQAEWVARGIGVTDYLLPAPIPGRHPGEDRHVSHSSVGRMLKRYVREAKIRAGDGSDASIYPHLFRHHLGTSMVNEGIPIPVVAKVLDHKSLEMTARYAEIHDETVRKAVMGFHERVNIRGERIALPVDGPLGEAAWMKERIARAKQALPNGYCGLPLQQVCPHPNACLSCASFLTDVSFRPIHQRQLEQTRALLLNARDGQQLRLVETLERDESSLVRILDGLDAIEPDHETDESVDVLQLATSPGACA